MDGFFRDIRYALRALLRTPVLFVAAVLTLAAGTGLATGVFAVAYGVLLRPLPYADADRLVVITPFLPQFERREVGVPLTEIQEWQRRSRAFESLAAYSTGDFTLRGAGEPQSVRATMVTERLLDVLGVRPAEGSTADVAAGRGVAISARLADKIGRSGAWRTRGLTLGPGDFAASAIMPAAFAFPDDRTDVWVRADAVPQIVVFGGRDQRRFTLIGKLSSGVTVAQATDDLKRVVKEIDAIDPASARGAARDAEARPLDEWTRRGAKPKVLPFLAGAVLVLLIACANVSGLLVGRAVSRQREFAVRRALGGDLAHVLRASLAESFTVAFAGWAAGLWIAWLVVRLFESRAAAAIPNLHSVRLDVPVLAGSLFLAVLVALISGGAPALRAARSHPHTALKQSSERIGRGSRAFRSALVVGQIALTIVLLVAAGLLMRTVAQIVAAERGFDARHASAMRLMLTQTVQFNAVERAPFINRLVERVRALPGVTAVGVGSDLPPGSPQLQMTISLVPTNGPRRTYTMGYAAATPGYLEAIGATLITGRLFDERDRTAAVPPAVITESAARAMFNEQEAVTRDWPAPMPTASGKRIRPRVIGVVKDIKYGGLDRAAPTLTIFTTWEYLAPGNAHLVVRGADGSTNHAAALRGIVQELDSSLPLFMPQTLDEVVSTSIADRRLRLQLAAAFALLALALASVALWGAVAQSVLDRRHELAVRLALGATSGNAVTLMLRGGLLLILTGVVLGGAAGVAAARALRHFLHGVSPFDPVTFAAGLGVAAMVSLAACYVPARRAAAISPAELLRQS